MKIKMVRVDGIKFSKAYKKILKPYQPVYQWEGLNHTALLELTYIQQLFSLTKQFGKDLIVSQWDDVITIYDDYRE